MDAVTKNCTRETIGQPVNAFRGFSMVGIGGIVYVEGVEEVICGECAKWQAVGVVDHGPIEWVAKQITQYSHVFDLTRSAIDSWKISIPLHMALYTLTRL